jgi:tetratricopeptide (TPR) repeat protein
LRRKATAPLAAIIVAAALAASPAEAAGERFSPLGAYLAGQQAVHDRDPAMASRLLAEAMQANPDDPALALRALQAHVAAGAFDLAVPLAERLAGAEETSLPRIVLVVAAMKKGDHAAARRLVGTLREEGIDRLLKPGLGAWIELGAGDAMKAVDQLRALVGVDGLEAFRDYHLALIYDAAGRDAEAAAAYAQALKRSSTPPLRLVEAAAAFHAAAGRVEEARALLARFLADNPEAVAAEIALKRLDEGRKPPRAVARPAEGMAELLLNLASALQGDSTGDAALLYGRLADYLRPDHPQTLLLIGSQLEADDQHEAAIAVFRRVAKDSVASWSARRAEASVLVSLKRVAEAAALLEAMGRERPERWDALAQLGNLWRGEKQWAKAVDAYDRAIARIGKVEARHWNLFYVRGIALERAKNWPRAEADFKRALELSPDEPYVLNYLAYTWVDRGENLDQAMAMLKKAVGLRPRDGAIVDSVGWAYYRLGRFAEAVEYLERAVELQPEDATINDHLGDVYWRVGRLYEARFQWQRALSLNPEPEDKPLIEEKLKNGMKPFEKPGAKQ